MPRTTRTRNRITWVRSSLTDLLLLRLRAGSRAFAHLVLTSPYSGSSLSTSIHTPEKLHYRQVADPKNPAYFLRNPSQLYGVSNHAFIAEKAYQMVYDFLRAIDPEYPHKLVQMYVLPHLITLIPDSSKRVYLLFLF
jgi:hypothetical protein